MTRERVRHVRDLLDEALQRDTANRAAYLAEACAGDHELRAEVEGLVDARRRMGGYLDRPAVEALDDPPLEPGARVGSFEILRVLGRGGGGVVYEARQDRPRRRVALKVMRADFASDWAQRRFREEAELLARLKHPGIAHVYEAGVHEDLPYFALEFVEDARDVVSYASGLDPRERLRLMARICDAVHHGHQKGVVHRDLKPGNVLVDGSGRVKIIDFGIARATGDAEEVAGTPPYMSPEQCGADAPVDVRSDVYSLGVLLYQLASGRLPYDVDGLPLTGAMRRVRDEPPAPLGRGDVAAIVDKAMRRDPAERYPSAAALGADLRRHLRHEPVSARNPSVLYHLGKFVRRNTVLTAAALVVLAVSIGAAVVSRRQARLAESARERAEYQGYLANVAAADAALRVHDVREAKERLRRAHPRYRHWDWSYLARRADESVRTGEGPGGGGVVAVFDPAAPDRVVGISNEPYHARGAVCAWDAASGRLLERTPFEPGFVSNVAARADGRRFAWNHGGDLRLGDRTFAVLGRRPIGTSGRVLFAPGRPLLVAGAGRELLVLADDPGLFVVRRVPCAARVAALAFDHAGTRLAAGLRDGTVRVWSFPAMELLHELRKHRRRVLDVSFTRDGDRLATASEDGTVRIWDAATGAALRRVRRHRGAFGAVRFGPEGAILFTGHSDGTVVSWNVETGNQVRVYTGHESGIASLDLSPDGVRLLSGGHDGTWKIWDARAGGRLLGSHDALVRDLCYGPDGRLVACATFDGKAKVYDARTRRLLTRIDASDGRVISVRFDDDGRLWTGASDGLVREWEALSGEARRTLRGHARAVCAVLPCGGDLLTGSEDGTLRVWDRATGKQRLRFDHAGWVWDVAAEPRSGLFAAPDWDGDIGVVRVRSLRDGDEVAALPIGAEVVCLAFSPDGRRLLAGDRAGFARRWRTSDWREAPAWEVGQRGVERIAFTPDGARAALACGAVVRLWDVARSEPVLTLRRHVRNVYGLAFRPDGAQLLSGGGHAGEDCAIRIWDASPRDPENVK